VRILNDLSNRLKGVERLHFPQIMDSLEIHDHDLWYGTL
jgi:hypothetical protein